MLTEKEKTLMSIIIMDDILGSYMLFPRSAEYYGLYKEWIIARTAKSPTDRQSALLEEAKKCYDEAFIGCF